MTALDDALAECEALIARYDRRAKLDAAIVKLQSFAYADDRFNEADHPRDQDGKFTSGASGAKVPTQRLTPTEKTYLSSYSGDDFLRVNGELRSGKATDPSIKHIDNAIEKSKPLPKGTVLYRGMTREAAKKLFPNGEVKRGETVSDPAFCSTSKSSREASDRGLGGVVLQIETIENAKGLDMKEHARNGSEQEVLLPRNAKMKVLGTTAPKHPGDPVVVRVSYGDT